MRLLVEVRGADVYVVQSLCGDAHASANDKLCRLLFFAGALKDAGARRVTACLPYLAYARKDRRTQERDPVTTRYVAALFEAVGIDRVIVLDVHNEVAFDNALRCPTLRLESALSSPLKWQRTGQPRSWSLHHRISAASNARSGFSSYSSSGSAALQALLSWKRSVSAA